MKQPTKRQLEVLKALNPFIGDISYQEAADQLGISEAAVKGLMQRLKERCPEVYRRYKELKKMMNEGQRAVDKAALIDPKKFKFLDITFKF